MYRKHWPVSKKRKLAPASSPSKHVPVGGGGGGGDDDDDDSSAMPFVLPKFPSLSHVYSNMNHIYFNDDITEDSTFALNRELNTVKTRMTLFAVSHSIPLDTVPIYLHLTTNGGCIHSAFSVVDTIQTLGVPVYTIVEGSVASAGTLISLAGKKRFIMPNAYMLLHELRSGVWGKMSNIEEEIQNLRKMMDHLYTYYETNTKMTKKTLEKLLTKDAIWNATECIKKGVVDEIYSAVPALSQ
jgi:ATP-dependent protease ClpP protease subunit